MKNIILIGMMGCGKTTVGRLLAQALGRELVDTDQYIQRALERTIPDIFAHEGEDFFRAQEQLAAQGQKLEELTLKIEDVDNLIDEVSSVAYDKAVELVTEEVKTMTHQEDIDMIEDTKVWLQSPERKAPKKERDYAMARLDGVIGKIRKAMQSTLEKVKSTLLRPDKKKAVTEEIKKQAKPSIVEALRRGMEEQRKKDSEKHTQEKQKKQNMEL